MEFIGELWRRALSVHPAPSESVQLALGLGALALVLFAWPLVRLIVTICHEGGHALAALLAGRTLAGIRLHTDTSGLTVTRGRRTGFGMVFTFLAGYPAPALIGFGMAWLAGTGYAAGALWLIVALLGIMLINIRNFYGALVVLGLGAMLAGASWYAPAETLSWMANGIAWLLLVGAPRPVFEVWGNRDPGTDSARLAQLTRLPQLIWIALWLLLTLGALVLGGWLLLPALRP